MCVCGGGFTVGAAATAHIHAAGEDNGEECLQPAVSKSNEGIGFD